ncbi:hypothetical protein FAZ95_36345 [Trinickia violacea]|uniref:DUF6966 domain-containing protein n=1 Tax=Trinickia violacea TaxID=2571746 RepID=A0A4P8J2P5_9BURK|nr:hypothetical protein [Trinickia violacea]QCP54403.1 hypothetical protein FAZ95_36345 [Trinickia violacea]
MASVKEICSVLIRMSGLLLFCDLEDWACVLIQFANRVEEGCPVVRAEILRLFGGMGSLNDLVLHKDGHVLNDENEVFDALRERLYELIRDQLTLDSENR